MVPQPFKADWADIGRVETELLLAILADAKEVVKRLASEREAGRPQHYAEHMAGEVVSRLKALASFSPHLIENFAPRKGAWS